MTPRPIPYAAFLASCLLVSGGARGYTVETSATYGCHEHASLEALEAAGYASPPPGLEADDRLLFSALDFDVSYVERDIYALSLVVGVRSNDVGVFPGVDISRLVTLHNDPDDQASHCLRAAWEDGEEGDTAAVESCRAAIRSQVDLAFDADAGGLPDPSLREPVAVNLMYQGRREVELSTFYYHLGKALHVLQDSFTHGYRTEDRRGIVEVMNWIDDVAGGLDQERDGPAHASAADDCRCGRAGGGATYDAAIEASAELLALASEPEQRHVREASLEEFLDRWVSHVPGCTRENAYCSSPDPVDLAGDPCSGCSAACGATRTAPAWPLLLLLAALALSRRRR
jgi:hypothetical protein